MGNADSKAEDGNNNNNNNNNNSSSSSAQKLLTKKKSANSLQQHDLEGTETSTDSNSSIGKTDHNSTLQPQQETTIGSSGVGSKRRNNQSKDGSSSNDAARDDEDEEEEELQQHTCSAHYITDDQVHVNLAMSDLMAYLQVVANNSSNLPLTRRDDFDLTVDPTSTTAAHHSPPTSPSSAAAGAAGGALSPEEYALRAAAFVPADVRVIGGMFTRYGRVWDLPTSEEFNASDGAQEPGKSYGGACVNSMLKVLYDAASNELLGNSGGVGGIANASSPSNHTNHPSALSSTGAGAGAAAARMIGGVSSGDALFDDEEEDDDDEENASDDGTGLSSGRSFRSTMTFSIDGGLGAHTCTMTWSDMLRKMKAEMKDIEYAQTPKITSSRKLDLSQTFSFVGQNFDPHVNQKRCLLIGCNYLNLTGAELKASHDDIRSMKDYIVNVHGFPETKELMTVLLDHEEFMQPTFLNIVDAFKRLSEESKPGDAVFVLFSGHGGRVLDAPQDAESYDEVILPSDFKQTGLIRDTLIFKTLIAPMRYGVTVTIIIDCCDTGMILDMPYAWNVASDNMSSSSLSTVGKMTMNEDFSFVRFLKVIKSLYEASTFTQLGRTVGSALINPSSAPTSPASTSHHHGQGNNGHANSDYHTRRLSSVASSNNDAAEINVSGDRFFGSKHDSMVSSSHESILDILTEACRPARRNVPSTSSSSPNNINTSHINNNQQQLLGCSSGTAKLKRDDVPSQSLLEQVINCTLLTSPEEDYMSDDDNTFRTRTFDEEVASNKMVQSFDTLSEDEDDVRRNAWRAKGRKVR